MALFILVLFLIAGLANWKEYVVLAVLFFAVGAFGPLAFILSQGYVAGKREEAQGRVEVARIERERR